MDGIADYEAWKAKQAGNAVGAAGVVIGAQDQQPDQIAGDLNLASEYGKVTGNPVPPAPMAAEYRSVFQAAIDKKRAETILTSSPRLTEWLRNPENAGVARDDLEGLSWWETGLGATANAAKRGAIRAAPVAANQYMAQRTERLSRDQGLSIGQILADAREPIRNAAGEEVGRSWARPSDIFEAGYRWLDSRTTPTLADPAAVSASYQQAAGEWAKRIEQIPMSPGGEAGKQRFIAASKAEGWQAQLSGLGAAFSEAPGEMTSFLMQTAVEALPGMAAAVGVGVATRNTGAAAAAMGGTSFASEYGSSQVEFFQEKGVDVSTPEGAMAAVTNPELMREAQERGVTRGAIIGILDGLSGGIAGTKLAESAFGNMVLQSVAQAVMGGAGEGLAQVASGQEFNIAEVVLEGLAEFAAAPVEVGGMAATRIREARAKAADAEARVGMFQELSGQAVSSKLRARMPDRFRQFVERATANGPVENIFVPASEFVAYFQSTGTDIDALIGELDGVSRDDLDVALAGGGDLKIPTATYAAKIAGSEHDAFLMRNMRIDPMEMTASEADEFNARVDAVMIEMRAEAEAAWAENEQWRATESVIYDEMVSRLRIAGRAPDVATNEAMVYPAFYRVMGERSGLGADEFLRQYPLPQVRGAIPQGMQVRNADEINRTLAELRSRVRGKAKVETPLLDFIAQRGGVNDVGGELSARNADGARRPGQKRLARALSEDGKPIIDPKDPIRYGWDDVAQAAVDAGFMANDPDVLEWQAAMENADRVAPDLTPVLLAAIDRELSGQAERSVNDVAGQAAADRDAALDEAEQYLADIGATLDMTDAEIRQIIEAAQADDGRMYAQNGVMSDDAAVSAVLSAVEAAAAEYEHVGIRITENRLEVGSTPENSRVWVDGEPTEETLNGASAVQVKPDEKSVRNALRASGLIKGGRSEYYGKSVSVIGSNEMTYGEDDGEIVMSDAVVVAAFERAGNLGPLAAQGGDERMYAQSGGIKYPTAPRSEWYSDGDYSARGGKVVMLSPDEYLASVRPLELDEESQENIDILAEHIENGGTLDPLKIYDGGKEDGRHRAYAAKSLGITEVPVIVFGDQVGKFSSSMNNSPRLLFQSKGKGPLGQFHFGQNGEAIISLFETANLSTMLHESGHYFLTVLQDMSIKGEPNAVSEYDAIRGWWGDNAAAVAADGNRRSPELKLTADDVKSALENGTTGDTAKDQAINVGMHEQWARAFEAYLLEGKAPNIELRSAFERFRAWLVSIYKSVAGLNVPISDDIRGVFDRMLATDAEIAKARETSGDAGAVFATAEQMGLTDEEYQRFLKLRGQAEDEAKARLMREIMEPIRREREKWFKDERAKVEDEVTRNVNAMPMFRALEWMGNRRWLGDGQPEGMPDMRLSKDILTERYGDGVLKTMRRGKQTVYSVDGGLDPDDAAGFFGFDSGDQLVKALERAPDRKEAIKAETDRVMRERHGDPLNDGEIEQIALDAAHGDKKGQWIAAELEAVRKIHGGDIGMTAKEARASARMTVSRMTVRDATASSRFLAAERKAANEAYRLAGDLNRAGYWETRAKFMAASPDGRPVPNATQADMVARLYSAKRRQLMNHALYVESRAVADEVGKAERYVQRLNKSTTREKIAGAGRRENAQTDYLAALDEILDRYDFRKMSGRAEERRGALVAFIDAMKAAGRENELAIPDAVLRDADRKPYKTVPVEELRGVIDSLKNIEHIATRWNDLIDATEKRNREQVISDVTAAMSENLPKRPPGRVATTGEGVRHGARQFLDLVLNAGTMLREIDGFKDMGAAYRNLKTPIDRAMDRLTLRKEKAAADLEALYAVYSKAERRRMAVREHIPELGYALSKWERIAVALNTGNEGNMQRLTDQRVRGSLTPAQVKAVLATLNERDADFVQSVWDYVNSFRDDIAAREKRATGIEPEWVEGTPVVIGGKTLKGGYYPLKYDPRLSTLARDDEAQDLAAALQAGRFGKAQTKRGHLEARAQSSGRAVELDMSVLHRHVNQVIYDLELSEPVANSWKVLQSGPVRNGFIEAGRQADFDALETWIKDVGTGQMNSADWINSNARRFKSNFTAAKLAFNLGTVAAQITGVSQTMVVVGKADFLRGLQSSLRLGIGDQIAAKSVFMRSRQTTFNKDIFDFYNDPKTGPVASRWGDFKRDWLGPASFWFMTKVQWKLVDIPTWMAGYEQGLRQNGNDEAKAIAHADAIVKRAQASGLFSDRSAIERGSLSRATQQSDVVRLFTTLGSYMFAKFNVAYERSSVARRTIRDEGVSLRSAREAASWTIDMAFLFTLEAVFMAVLKGKLPDEDDEDETWTKFLAKETAMSVMGTIPFVRDVASVGSGFEGGGAYGGITAEIAKPFQEAAQGEADKGFVKSVISGTGLFMGLPATQINRAVDAGWRAAEGEDVSVLEYLLGKRGK